jgi:uncharacterized protein (DUF433 family)
MTTTRVRAYTDRIVSDPSVMTGKPVVKGTRLPVERVIQHLADNPDVNDLFLAFPHLTIEDVKACLAYAHDQLERGIARRKKQARTGQPAA